ncbi:MAG: sigma 54-interacting transcriptional regulator [Bacilli bacterium]|uniref:sigma 54-interacting transcriptional regulator n=1 Tax=Anaerorhabdus sp. TaxID=1872524 RepID=UPI002FC73923
MNKETKKELYELVVKCTFEFCSKQMLVCDSNYLSSHLNISRSLASQYLNEYYKEEVFIKVHTRPVFFLDKHTIEDVYQITLDNNEFYDSNDLVNYFVDKEPDKTSFLKAIGHDTSLSECIMQCQSAIKYPPNGLPILLYGEHGVGKTFISELVYQYSKDEKIIDKDARLVFFNENRYKNDENKEKDIDIIFGTYLPNENDKCMGGLIAKAKNGILVIENIETLSPQCYFQLIHFIQTGEYSIRNKNKNAVFKSRTRLIFTSCLDSKEQLHNTFFHNIPIICYIPNLANRAIEDKEKLIIEFFKEEALIIKKDILISNKVLNALVNCNYQNNIEGLKTCIKTSCANAFLNIEKKDTEVNIRLYHLPTSIINSLQIDRNDEEEDATINISKYLPQTKDNRILDFFDYMIILYNEYLKSAIDFKQFNERSIENMNSYYDYIVFENKYYNARVKVYEKVIMDVFENMLDLYDIYVPTNCAYVVSRVIYSYMQTFSSIRSYEMKNRETIDHLLSVFKETYPDGYRIASEIITKIRFQIDIEINKMNYIFLILNIQFYNRSIDKYKYNCVIISHGYSTASSIADATNKLVGNHIIESIDMPINTSIEEIVKMLKKYISSNGFNKNLILLVDMGSLEDLGNQLVGIANINIGIINNVSTRLALNVAYEIKKDVEMKQILEKVSIETKSDYKIFSNVNKKKAILFTSETGKDAIERIVQLFKNSMPKQIDINIFAYDYSFLIKNKEEDDIFKIYDVLFIVGTKSVNINSIPFILIEDVIAFKDTNSITSILNTYYTKVEQEEFNRNLIKNFTLENVMNYLTVLNADKVIGYIEEALDNLQNLLGVILSNKTIIGMYLHISCIVERLIMKSEIKSETYSIQKLNSDQKRFQKLFNDSFTKITEYYKITIPISEIIYIYDFIFKK